MADKKLTYSDKLKDPRWQKKRLQIFERDHWTCQWCFGTTKTLAVHHKVYKSKIEPWDYEDSELLTVCEDCHQYDYDERASAEHDLLRALKWAGASTCDVYALAEGFINQISMSTKPVDVSGLICAFGIVLATPEECEWLLDRFHLRDSLVPGRKSSTTDGEGECPGTEK